MTLYGVAYYPEHDDPQEWKKDAILMQNLGINCVRIGEFCWSRMQQSNGTFSLDWIENLIELHYTYGIQTVLCTPTAAPPVWICQRYPDLPCVSADGRQGLFGGRQHFSFFHEQYRKHCVEIATALAERFGTHEAIAGWQIDNEAGSYFTVDCSSSALKAFHVWLGKKYQTVDELNRKWGLIFWNQEVERFDQVPAPTEMMCTRNPSLILDYNRFCLEGIAEYLLLQARPIRSHSKDKFILASAVEGVMDSLLRLQQQRKEQLVDTVTVHNYPELRPQPCEVPMHLERFHSLARNNRMPLYVMEQQIGSGHTTSGGLKHEIRRFWTFEAFAAGASTVFWFHWRRFRTGCEWRHTGVVERDRKKRGVFRSIQALINELRSLEPILENAEFSTDVQVLYHFDNILGFDRSNGPVFWMEIQRPEALQQRMPLWEREVRTKVYHPLTALGLNPGFVLQDGKWDISKPLIAVDLDVCSPQIVKKIKDFCSNGGTFICFPGAGERDLNGGHVEAPPPGTFSELLGVELDDYYPLGADCGIAFDHQHGTAAENVTGPVVQTTSQIKLNGEVLGVDIRHGEFLNVNDAKILATYTTKDQYDGKAAISCRKIGKGRAVYLGTTPANQESAMKLYRSLLPETDMRETPLREVRFNSGSNSYSFLMNDKAIAVELEKAASDEITGTTFTRLEPWGVLIVKT